MGNDTLRNPMARECPKCEFFDAGNCRRFPPTVAPWPNDNQHPVLYTPETCWPQVNVKDWCGEFRTAKEFQITGGS